MKTVFSASQHRCLGYYDDGKRAKIATLALPTAGDSGKDVNLIPICPAVQNQGQIGDCASWSAVTFDYAFHEHQGPSDLMASATKFYGDVRKRIGVPLDQDSGSTISDTITTGMEDGFCPASVYPNNDALWNVAAPEYANLAALKHKLLFAYYCPTTDTIDASLQQGFPVRFGMQLTESFERIGKDGIYLPGGKLIGGHAMAIVGVLYGMTAGGYQKFYIVQNQWSAQFGYFGYCFIPAALFEDGTASEMVTSRRTAV